MSLTPDPKNPCSTAVRRNRARMRASLPCASARAIPRAAGGRPIPDGDHARRGMRHATQDRCQCRKDKLNPIPFAGTPGHMLAPASHPRSGPLQTTSHARSLFATHPSLQRSVRRHKVLPRSIARSHADHSGTQCTGRLASPRLAPNNPIGQVRRGRAPMLALGLAGRSITALRKRAPPRTRRFRNPSLLDSIPTAQFRP